MTLAAGTRLGPYEIQAALGAGGMEVYRARDTRLDRTIVHVRTPSVASTRAITAVLIACKDATVVIVNPCRHRLTVRAVGTTWTSQKR